MKQKSMKAQYIENCELKAKVAEEVYPGWIRISRRWLRKAREDLLNIKDNPGKQKEFLVLLAFYIRDVLRAKYEPTITGKHAARLYAEIQQWAVEKGGEDIAKLM